MKKAKKIIIRADDLGYSEAVNYGIEKSVKEGLINNVGVMVNMPATMHGVQLLEKENIAFGQHTNICAGRPVTDAKLIPSITDKEGFFKTSKEYRLSKEDFVVIEEAVLEIEAQYEKFKEIFGKDPDYFEAHAIKSNNFFEALEIVAKRHRLHYFPMPDETGVVMFGLTKIYAPLMIDENNYDPVKIVKDMVNNAHDDGIDLMVCHPGYLDAYILKHSSWLIPRTQDVEMLTSTEMAKWLEDENVIRVTYKELNNEI